MKSILRSKTFPYYPEDIPIHLIQFSETVSSLKPFFSVSRFFGVPNFSVVEAIVSRGGFWTFLALLSLFILVNQIFLLAVQIIMREDFVRRSGPEIIFRTHVILVLLWSLYSSSKLSKALRFSPLVENRINKVYNGESESLGAWTLRRKCIFWTFLYICLSLALSLLSLLVPVLGGGSSSEGTISIGEIWSSYGERKCSLSIGINLHPVVSSVYCLIMEISSNFLWIFGDFLLLLLSLTLALMFRRINVNGIQKIEPTRLSSIEIDLVREHHGLMSKLVKDFDDALASLSLINVVFNTTFIVLSVYSIVSSSKRGVGEVKDRANERIIYLYCKIGIAVFKLLGGLISASILHHRAHEGLSEIRSWPMAREFNDFSLNNGRASVMQAFVAQLSMKDTGFTVGKVATITGKLLCALTLGVGFFVAFARITISSCVRNSKASFLNFLEP